MTLKNRKRYGLKIGSRFKQGGINSPCNYRKDLKMNYIVYEASTNRNIFLTDDFDHAFNLCFQFNNEAKNKEKYDIKKG